VLATIVGKSTQNSPCKTISHIYTYSRRELTNKVYKKAKLMIAFRAGMSRASQVNSSSAPHGQGCHFSFPPKGLDIL